MYASYIHASGSRVQGIHTSCSYASDSRIRNHIYMQARIMHPTPRIALSVRWSVTKFQPHHTHMHHSQGSRITDVCIIHKCIMHICIVIKDNRCMHHTCMYQGQGSWLNASYICAAWPHASCIMHHASCIMHHWIMDKCIMHRASCIIGSWINASCICAS